MDHEITLAQFQHWLLAYANRIIEQEIYLTELDTAIGDADHGINMRRGADKLRGKLADAADYRDISVFLRSVAMTLIKSIGGAAGPLYGSFFLRAAQAASSHQLSPQSHLDSTDSAANPQHINAVSLQDLAFILRDGLEGVKHRGKAEVGEKTMIDAMQPAIEALEEAVQAGYTTSAALELACHAAECGMKKTIDLQASKGRASYLGLRSIGHQDPGATSTYYLFETAVQTLGKDE